MQASIAYTNPPFICMIFPSVFDLSELTEFTINGASGNAASIIKDVNGDGIDDILIGDPSGASGAGKSYVVFGSPTGFGTSLEVSSLDGSNGFAVNGAAGSRSGLVVSGAGDVNNDGINDFAIGADSHNHIVFGRATGFDAGINLANLDGRDGFSTDIPLGLQVNALSSAGDINGDGIDDFIVGATNSGTVVGRPDVDGFGPGKSYILFGRENFDPRVDVSTLDGSNGFVFSNGERVDYLGVSVSAAGDINNDGLDDIIIGAPFAKRSETSPLTVAIGEAYVVYGRSTGFAASLQASDLDGSNGFVINSISEDDALGYAVSGAGDVNGDGIADIIVGAPSANRTPVEV